MPALSGINPILEKACMNDAFSEASTISHARAMLAPAPAATPLTAAMIGLDTLRILRMMGL